MGPCLLPDPSQFILQMSASRPSLHSRRSLKVKLPMRGTAPRIVNLDTKMETSGQPDAPAALALTSPAVSARAVRGYAVQREGST